jgi:hypothetical protein
MDDCSLQGLASERPSISIVSTENYLVTDGLPNPE